jgi:hypothetical protein
VTNLNAETQYLVGLECGDEEVITRRGIYPALGDVRVCTRHQAQRVVSVHRMPDHSPDPSGWKVAGGMEHGNVLIITGCRCGDAECPGWSGTVHISGMFSGADGGSILVSYRDYLKAFEARAEDDFFGTGTGRQTDTWQEITGPASESGFGFPSGTVAGDYF